MPKLRLLKFLGLAAALALVAACFLPWVVIESRGITVTGLEANRTNFGKPGYFHLLMVVFFITCTLIQRIWAKRLNLLVTALNIAWAARNYFFIAACSGGECPVKKIGLWLVVISSVLMLVSALFPDIRLDKDSKTSA